MVVKLAFAFDQENFPVKIKMSESEFTNKSELIESLRESLKSSGYKVMNLLSNESFNSVIEPNTTDKKLALIFKDHAEVVFIEAENKTGFFSRIFGN